MKALSLYAGIGGEALAAHAAGFEHVAFCEADPYCRKVLARHWPEAPCFEVDNDVTVDAFRERGIPMPDLISGGPPRLTSVRANRVNRLKALGNIAVPAQLYPLFAAIAAVEAAR